MREISARFPRDFARFLDKFAVAHYSAAALRLVTGPISHLAQAKLEQGISQRSEERDFNKEFARGEFVAIGNVGVAAGIQKEASASKRLETFLNRYFYLCMSLLLAALVLWGFSRTVDASLLHANPPRPLVLWMHGAAFSLWIVFFIVQSVLVKVRKMSVHRLLGWFGAGLAAVMVVLGTTVAVVMTRFDTNVLHQKNVVQFLSIPFVDMIIFGTCVGLAIYWRKKPEYHRRLVLVATCALMDAPLGRFDFMFNNNLFFPTLDCLIVAAMARDWIVDGRVHKVYRYALPAMIALQCFAMYTWRINPTWWQVITQAIMGL